MVYKAVTSIPDPSLTRDVCTTAPGVCVTMKEIMRKLYPATLKHAEKYWKPIESDDDIYKMFGSGLWDGSDQYIVGV